ncbi:HAMP domain-containing sensor histidine kinase [Streptomyces melanogenes]|uniref:histidine kinase n=1 Tax=Streptomyces melanogenes TaxID=67326 RepID=A0ABZ1XD04_9ACTN|nr:HAMP domain-containing sensor histidine kinase [Streptomyces melanogenes]
MTRLAPARLLRPTTARARLTRRAAGIAALGTVVALGLVAFFTADTAGIDTSDAKGAANQDGADSRALELCRSLGLFRADGTPSHPPVSGWMWLWAVAAVTVVAAGTCWFALGSVLRPVEEARSHFSLLATDASEYRLPLPRNGDEITHLVQTMNSGLNRLQTTVEQQRRFVADASHELRSPLAALQAELEIALSHPDRADWPDVVRAALGDTRRLRHLTEDLLLLARLDLDKPAEQHRMEKVDLTDLVREETARRHPPTHVDFHLDIGSRPLVVQGHPALLARVLGNLLDNAERHASSSVTIRLSHDAEERQAVLDVVDDGPGIPPADRARVFERFTRLDTARTRHTGGTGLGLAIARRVTALHHGTLTITPTPHGAHLTARLPALGHVRSLP